LTLLKNCRSKETTGGALPVVLSTPAAQALRERLEKGGVFSFGTIAPAAQPFFALLLARLFPGRTIVAVTEGLKAQELFHQDLQTWMTASGELASAVRFYPAWETLPHEAKLPHADVISERLETLCALDSPKRPPLIVTTMVALLQKTFSVATLRARARALQQGASVDPLDLVEWLEEQGYEPEAQVAIKGTMALRGGILDLWPLTSAWPARLEFFGNELASLRWFDPVTQISRDEMESIVIPPGGELGLLKRDVQSGRTSVLATFFEHLPLDAVLLWCGPDAARELTLRYLEQVPPGDLFHLTLTQFDVAMAGLASVELNDFEQASSLLPPSAPPTPNESTKTNAPLANLTFQGMDVFRPIGERTDPHIAEAQRKEFFSQIHRWMRQGYQIEAFCNNDGEKQRFEEIWREYNLGAPSGLTARIGALSRGFLCENAKIAVITDSEIFGRYRVQRPRRLKSARAQTTRSLLDINFSELEEGDYVVHLERGIGRFLGLQVIPASLGRKPLDRATTALETSEECLVIEYAPSEPGQQPPKLYVPVSEAHLVSKYVGAGKARPPLNTLSGTRWAKAKAQAQIAVRDLAAEMLTIQAARESQSGFAYPTDSGWQREFENSFIYEETPDQMRAIVAAKNDLESSKPMDRLICGDVGYGKTEVAIRAAFKVALAGKQVAVLVPTTVLAQQHYNTFCERMADFPLRIDLLSRFRARRQLTQTMRDLTTGAVDIVIGTHRLLQPDIQFKDLGLVIIDEEQRFGVMHKEKFKRLRTLVDVLTLSATPIPRTLYLALSGARDMSTIETPPQDRLPVETIVAQYDERVIRDAIQRELNRGGQVFFLHNRVLDIENVAALLHTLVPKARIGVGHGQMHSDDLEKVMTRFVNGEIDVLLSTTIVESGLDIPNANTIIIDRADRFGLSDLYQLRGRVGRYKHQAYAYLLLPRHAGLLSDARKRISAIKQYSTLGSGFKIAMRDLEIRGAGNLLGSQQSGHITAVGFDLYCQLLKQSVSSLKGEKIKPRVEVEVRLDFLTLSPEERAPEPAPERQNTGTDLPEITIQRDVAVYHSTPTEEPVKPERPVQRASARIPNSYVADSRQRIEVHRKLSVTNDLSALHALKNEWRDRFGPLPPEAELTLKVRELKIIAAERSVTSIESKDNKLMLTRNNDYVMIDGKFPRLTKNTPSTRLNEIKRLLLSL
jgi:transcription-repair coupling factor (superfamily II helicase)